MINRINVNKLTLLLALALVAIPVFAQFGGGDGSSGNPYQISSVVHLNNLRGTAYLGKYFIQNNDLDLSATNPTNVNAWSSGTSYSVGDYVRYTPGATQFTYICIQATSSENPSNTAYWTQMWESAKGWKPIGDSTNYFHGVYDGNNKRISNLYINRGASPSADNVYPSDGEDNIGLFGYVANGSATTANNFHATIKGLGLINPNITGRRATASLVGRVLLPNTTPARSFTVYIENCYAEAGSGGSATVSGFGAVGGLVGANNSNAKQRVPVIRFCYAKVSVSATHPNNYTPNPNDQVGTSGIYNPYNIKYGGLVGCNENGITQDSFARGNVTGGDRVGGLAGCTIGGAIFRSYSTGTVTRNIQPGGSLPNYEGGIGGLVGRTSGSLPPGLGGTNQTGSCEDCFWDYQTSGTSSSPGGTPKTTTEMKTQGTFTNWDFVNVWGIDAVTNDGYPYLRGATSTDYYYRSKQTGNWNQINTWQISTDNSNWIDAVVTPDESNSISILIRNTHTVTVTQNVYVDATTIESGGTVLVASGQTLFVDNGIGDDLTVNGTLRVTGSYVPGINTKNIFNNGSLLEYDGSSAQSTGSYLFSYNDGLNQFETFVSVYDLTIDNEAGVSFTNPILVRNLLSVDAGTYSGSIVRTDGVFSPNVKFFEFPATGYSIEGYASTMNTGQPNMQYIKRMWNVTGNINNPTAVNRTKNITFYWTSDDDYNYAWGSTVPILYAGATPIVPTSGNYDTSVNPRWLRVDYTFPQSAKASVEFKIGLEEDQTLPVELSSFTATINAYNYVQIQWVTQSETNVSGFRLYRGVSNSLGNAGMLNVYIPATNTSQAQYYLFTDYELSEPGVYYYWLENVDMNGSTAFHGPVSVHYDLPEAASPSVPIVKGINSIFPNPFNPDTTIRFGIENDSAAKVVIYNSRGQLIRTLFNGNLAKGTYNLHWNGLDENGNSVGSGLYYLRLQSGQEVYNRKLTLVK